MPPIHDHPLRYALTNELHARPFPTLNAPCRIVFLAIKKPIDAAGRDRAVDVAHLVNLLDRFGAAHPQPGATHYSGQIGRSLLKWEQHTEFVTYTAFLDGLNDRAFDPADYEVFPSDWLEQAPGQRMTSAMLRICLHPGDAEIDTALGEWFVPESLAVARVVDDAAVIAGDFRIDPAGHLRFALFVDPKTGSGRIGRIVQRVCEIETYKTMSMLGFSRAQMLSKKISTRDSKLTRLMGDMTGGTTPAEKMLPDLLSISADLETLVAQASFRFGATRAYEAIVTQRIAALREQRFQGRQTFAEFMMRRYEPAMRTVNATERRLQALADRAMRTGQLLRTRVDVERSAQQHAVLESMDTRAALQLRLQHTVEGLSVVAISYYAVSLVAYALYPLAQVSGVGKGMMTAIITPVVVLAVWGAIRRIRKKLE